MKRRRPKQLELTLKTWGGKREGAGRKPRGKKSGIPHRARLEVSKHHPVHVTLRVASAYRNLRTQGRLAIVRRSAVGAEREGFRITDWSVQRNHIHLIVEAHDADELGRGIRSFSIRTAKGLNALSGRTGVVFPDRYHHHVLKTPREMRSTLCYVREKQRGRLPANERNNSSKNAPASRATSAQSSAADTALLGPPHAAKK